MESKSKALEDKSKQSEDKDTTPDDLTKSVKDVKVCFILLRYM